MGNNLPYLILDMPITAVVSLVRIMWQNQTYSLCKSFVLQWDIIDLDNTLILLEEILFLGKAVFFDPFNVKAQSPIWIYRGKHIYGYVPVPDFVLQFYESTLPSASVWDWVWL